MTAFDERMAKLRERFVERAGMERTELIEARHRRDRETLRRLAHGLSGSAGVFGFPEISVEAARLETAVDEGASEEDVDRLAVALTDRLGRDCQLP